MWLPRRWPGSTLSRSTRTRRRPGAVWVQAARTRSRCSGRTGEHSLPPSSSCLHAISRAGCRAGSAGGSGSGRQRDRISHAQAAARSAARANDRARSVRSRLVRGARRSITARASAATVARSSARPRSSGSLHRYWPGPWAGTRSAFAEPDRAQTRIASAERSSVPGRARQDLSPRTRPTQYAASPPAGASRRSVGAPKGP